MEDFIEHEVFEVRVPLLIGSPLQQYTFNGNQGFEFNVLFLKIFLSCVRLNQPSGNDIFPALQVPPGGQIIPCRT